MAVLNATVLLLGYTFDQQLEVPDKEFYQDYFFNPQYGLSAYWLKQTSNKLFLNGNVIEWAFGKDPNPDLSNRATVLNFAIAEMEQTRGVNFIFSDLVICVLGVPGNINSDGGSTTCSSVWRTHHGIVGRVGDTFDFWAHEIGHALGLQHSYGRWDYKNSSYSKQGEYGHPFCIMSAMGYGGTAGSFSPAQPRLNRKEYTGLGPSLNAATAAAKGWIDTFVYNLPAGQPMEVVIRSREWGGTDNNFNAPPQALDIRAADGKNYVIEYRENLGWDEGHPACIIINQGNGGLADIDYPNTNSGTFLKSLALPFNFGTASNIYNGKGFAIEVLQRFPGQHTIRLRITPGHIDYTEFSLTSKLKTKESSILESGEMPFRAGDVYCVSEGIWAYTKRAKIREATFVASYALAIPPITVVWTVDGFPLTKSSGSIVLFVKLITIAEPKFKEATQLKNVELHYEITSLPTGSRLTLTNRPEDETYSVDVVAALSTDIGLGTDTATVKFEGIQYQYPSQLYIERNSCIIHIDPNDFPSYKAIIPDEGYKKIPEEKLNEIEKLLTKLGHLVTKGDQEQYHIILNVLKDATGINDLKVSLFPIANNLQDKASQIR